jgi:hypothetical protein
VNTENNDLEKTELKSNKKQSLKVTFSYISYTGAMMMKMTNDDVTMMERYGITCEQKSIYQYKKYQYGNLQDAINFAKLDDDRAGRKLKNNY